MKISSIASNYMKFAPLSEQISANQRTDGKNEEVEKKDAQKADASRGEKSTFPSTSNPGLAGILKSEEKQALASLFGIEGLAKLDAIMENGEGTLPDIPRGLLLNIKV